MLTRTDYLHIKQELIKELFMPFLIDERKEVIRETLETISLLLEEKEGTLYLM